MRNGKRLEVVVCGIALVALAILFVMVGDTHEVVLADAQRAGAARSDFVMRFLERTVTPHRVEEGFVVLPSSSLTEQRLLQLLGALRECQYVVVRQQRMLGNGESVRPMTWEPTEEGGVGFHVTNEEVPNTRIADELAAVKVELERQIVTVAKALRTLRPGVVIPEEVLREQTLQAVERTTSVGELRPVSFEPVDIVEPFEAARWSTLSPSASQ
ncbi:hypothetical protein Pan216_08820 [Planctomycetes bacterium Pan216]|uniref:Uncharacterized protein n=1 Tax=Kolteria novifilia TaxID=2527975 RepID=A0A518AZA2_9BACT|nr:hypothetical protein Pan216_08820 [Planctomycetes bacterium Pan216]